MCSPIQDFSPSDEFSRQSNMTLSNLVLIFNYLIMNKKFSTFVAALLLSASVGTFTAQAATTITIGAAGDPLGTASLAYEASTDKGYENGKSYLLYTSSNALIGVDWNDAKQVWELKKVEKTVPTDLPSLYKVMWTVQVVENAGAEPVYTFINKYTQTVLSVDVAAAKANAAITDLTGVTTGHNAKELNYTMDGGITLFNSSASYKQPSEANIYANVGNDEVVYLAAAGSDGDKIYSRKVSKATFEKDIKGQRGILITPYKMGEVILSANDLNTMLYAGLPAGEAKSTDFFDLSFDPALSSVFTDSKLQAVKVEQKELKYGKKATDTDPYVTDKYASLVPVDGAYKAGDRDFVALKNVKGEYLVVDTAYVPGTDNNNNGLLKFTTDGLFNSKNDTRYRRPESYLFKFTLNVTDETVAIESMGFVRRSKDHYLKNNTTVTGLTGDLATYYGAEDPENSYKVAISKPGSHWYQVDDFDGSTVDNANKGGMVKTGNTRFVTHVLLNTEDIVTLGEMKPATAATASNIIAITVGAQNIYVPTTMPNGAYLLQDVTTGMFLVDNLVGNTELVEQAVRQDFQHMPAAQWIVTSNGNATKVVNREFENTYKNGILYKGAASDQAFFYGDTKFKFIPVADVADKYQGYKWIKDAELNETRFTFNYLHDLAMDKPLNTINSKDSVIWVDKDGEAMNFSLEQVVDDEYGYNGGLTNIAMLNRRVYKIKVNDANKLVNNKRYLAYSEDQKKYVVTKDDGDVFFLKENNDVNGEHYYTFLRANLGVVGKIADVTTIANQVKQVGTKFYFVAGTINNVATRVEDNDVAPYYYAKKGSVVNQFGLVEEGYIPEVTWVKTNNIVGYQYLATEKEGEAVGMPDGALFSTDRWTRLDDNNVTWYAIYDLVETDNSDYASHKVSVDNNTLALVNGVLSDGKVHEVANSAFAVKYSDSQLYRRVAGMENVKVYRVNSTDKEYLYEDALSKYSAGKEFNFLGVEGKGDAKNAAMFLDTAYVNRETIMPQYMFVLRPEFTEADTIWCDATEGHKHATLADSLACDHTSTVAQSVKGWYLVNLTDSVAAENARIADAEGGILSNKYLLDKTKYTRLGFVKATHIGDKLIIDNSIYTGDTRPITPGYATTLASKDTIDLSKNAHNNVAFSFRLVDDSDDFLIESQGAKPAQTNGGWIKIQNGVPVIAEIEDYREAVTEAELFNLEATDEDPTANEAVEASEVSVVAVQGAIIVKGAAGKVVTVANILGQTIANQVAASDNVTIAAPAGVAVVTVDGEATKVIVK